MPHWTCEPDADQKIELAISCFKNGLYKSREDAVKSHGVDPNTLRRRLNGKHKSHKVAHTRQQRLLPPAESAVVRQCIYLTNAGFPARIWTIRAIATKILEEKAAAKEVDEEANTQVEVEDDEQSDSSDSEASDEDVGMDMGNVVQSIE